MGHEVRLLGPWELRNGNGPVRIPGVRLRILLTSLALSANQTVGVDTLTEQLWPDRRPVSPRRSLHTYVGRLRQLLGPRMIRTQPGIGYQIHLAPDAVDLHRFRDLLRQAARVRSTDAELRLLRAALTLWRGDPFADLSSSWLDREVAPRLTEEWFAATRRRIELELDTEDPEPLIAELRILTDQHPTRELLWLQLISALHRAGRRSEALEAFRRASTILRHELGIEPGEALAALRRTLDGPATEPTLRRLPNDILAFTGREPELATLDRLLAETGPAPPIVTIGGAAGVGKTTLAVHWAHRIAHRYPDGQLYLNLRGYGPGDPLTSSAAAEMLLRELGVDGAVIPSELDERSALLRSRLSGRMTMIVLDDAHLSEQVRPLLPGSHCLVIVTSRTQLRGLSIRDGAHRVMLQPLPQRQSVDLLAARLGAGWVEAEPEAASTVVELCDRLPLALAIVAERAHRAGSLAQVVTELSSQQARLDTLDDGAGAGLRATLSWSYRALSDEAAAMFRKLGVHPAGDIEVRAAAALADVPIARAQAVLDQLVSVHLVQRRHPNRYQLHDLIRLYAGEMAAHDPAAERAAAVGRVLDWYLHAAASADRMLIPDRRRDFLAPHEPATPAPRFDSPEHARSWFEQEYESLRCIVAAVAGTGFAGHAWRIALTMTTFFDHTIPWSDGLEFYRLAFAAAQASGELVGEAYVLNSLGCIHRDMGDLETAKSRYRDSLKRFTTLENLFGQAMTLGNLGLVHGELGDVDAAREYATLAMALFAQTGYSRGVASNLENLGTAYMVAGEYQQAVECYEQALPTFHQFNDHEFESWTQHGIGRARAQLGQFPLAIRAFRRAITLYRTLGNRRLEANGLADLGTTLGDAGHAAIARSVWQSAKAILTELNDPRAQEIQAAIDGDTG